MAITSTVRFRQSPHVDCNPPYPRRSSIKTVLISYPTWQLFNEDKCPPDGDYNYPVGVLTLVSSLRQAGRPVEFVSSDDWLGARYRSLVDLNKCEAIAVLAAELAEKDAQVYGFSTINQSYPFTLLVAQRLKEIRPDIAIVLGGPQATATAVQTMETFDFIDYILCNEADETLPEFLSAMEGHKALDAVSGLFYRTSTGILRTGGTGFCANLDSIPLPTYDLVPPDKLAKRISIEAGRGCPYNCRFCVTNAHFSRRFRMKSPKRLVTEMVHLYRQFGARMFTFVHDLMIVNRKALFELFQEIKDSDLPSDVGWGCSARTDLVDDELLDAAKEAGCKGMYFGIETGSKRMQKVINKNLDLDKAFSVIESAARRGMECFASFITGFPDESHEDQRDTVNAVVETQRYRGVTGQLHVFSMYANTPYFQEYKDGLSYIPQVSPDAGLMPELVEPETELVRSSPLIFSNFYVYTRGLDPERTKRLQLFYSLGGDVIQDGINVRLKDDRGCFLRAFEEWEDHLGRQGILQDTIELTTWQQRKPIELYEQHLRLVRNIWGNGDAALDSLASLALTKLHVSRLVCRNQSTHGDRPIVVPWCRLVVLRCDPYITVERIRDRTRASSTDVPSCVSYMVKKETDGRVRVYKISDIAAHLLSMCDGTRTTGELQNNAKLPDLGLGIPSPWLVCRGLSHLYDQGFIEDMESQQNTLPFTVPAPAEIANISELAVKAAEEAFRARLMAEAPYKTMGWPIEWQHSTQKQRQQVRQPLLSARNC